MAEKTKNVYILTGIQGSGKSTWLKNNIDKYANSTIVSRDEIRFRMVQPNEPYFSKEKEVFDTFVNEINSAIEKYDSVFIDATHLNQVSRNKVLDKLNLENVRLNAINFDIPVLTCINQNDNRRGRERVPREIIYASAKKYVPASFKEKHKYKTIMTVQEKKKNG